MDNLKRSVCVLLSAVVVTFVSAEDLKDGCMVLDGLNKTTLERNLTLLVAEPLAMDLRMMVIGVQQNSSIENWRGGNNSLAPRSWTPATIQLYPQLRLSVHGHPIVSGERFSSREDMGPLRIVVENILLMTNCPEGNSVWKISANESLGFHLGDRENFTIIANEYVPLYIHFDRIKHIMCMTDGKPVLRESRYTCAGEERPPVRLNLQITLSDTEYKILGNGHKLKNQKWNKDRSNEIKFTAKADMTNDIYVLHPLPLTVQPTRRNTAGPTAAIVALTVVVVVLVTLLCLALIFFLRNSPLLFKWKLWQRSHQDCTAQHSVAHEEVPVAASSKDKVKRAPVSEPLQHTAKPWPKTQVGYTAQESQNVSQNDYDTNYIVAKDVKPIEVEVLRQQNVIRGKIYHQSPSTWSAPAAQYNAQHNPASRQQSANTNYSHASTLDDDEDSIYLNRTQGDSDQRISTTSELYDTIYNSNY
ncbi:uncharacterized protein [Cherax quadricarinatus]|uniref:uncharacterized protein isoform X1 n=1 Tax=Cherax quadricarinatus TaxID=27406 RepID=UPI0023789772|nr:uncharacterized protein LOC128703011 [Cherax quadricarinatus]